MKAHSRAMAASISVVTGAAGFVGQALVCRLLADDDVVRAIVLPGDRCTGELRERVGRTERLEIVEADTTDAASIMPAFAGATRVFHTAALVHAWVPWERFRAVNVGGIQNVARAALEHKVARLVAVSTTDVFGIPRADEVFDEASPVQRWHEPYVDTKIEAEQWLWQFRRETGLPVSVIYPGWVYGPGDHAFFPSLATAIADGSMLFWYHGARLPWVYIDNLVDACVLASTHPAAVGNGYIVHDDTDGPTLEEVCAQIAAAIDAPAPARHVPYAVAFGAAWVLQSVWRLLGITSPPPLLTVDVKAFGFQWRLATAKVRAQLGWTPRVSVDDGMRRALEHVRDERAGRGRAK